MTTNTTPQEHQASNKPTFTPNYWEKKHGKVIDGVFHCPSFSVHYKGQPIRIHGVEHKSSTRRRSPNSSYFMAEHGEV